MRYKGLTISWEADYCIRDSEDTVEVFDGLNFSVLDGYKRPLESFNGIYGVDFSNNTSEIEEYVKRFIDKYEAEYVSYLQRKGWDNDALAARINKVEETEGREVSYHLLAPLDSDGEILYKNVKRYTKIDPLTHFRAKYNSLIFNELSNYDLIKYAEAVKLGKCEYDGGFLKSVTIDYGSDEYSNYEIEILGETLEEMLIKKITLEELAHIQSNFLCYYSASFSYTMLHPEHKETYLVENDIDKLQNISLVNDNYITKKSDNDEDFDEEI
ncbi:MAG: hypothetical protein PHE51_12445 [Eubacteriales bacterium]|nr:hypothetical protein [Eubacteriales bacterium]